MYVTQNELLLLLMLSCIQLIRSLKWHGAHTFMAAAILLHNAVDHGQQHITLKGHRAASDKGNGDRHCLHSLMTQGLQVNSRKAVSHSSAAIQAHVGEAHGFQQPAQDVQH